MKDRVKQIMKIYETKVARMKNHLFKVSCA